MATVYYWKFLHPGHVGHLSIQVGDIYVSFWPDNAAALVKPGRLNASLQADIKAEGCQPDETFHIPAKCIDTNSFRTFMETQKTSMPGYQLLTNNCGQVVMQLLRNSMQATGIYLDSAGITPKDNFEKIKLAVARITHVLENYPNYQQQMQQSRDMNNALDIDDYPWAPPVPEHLQPKMKFWPWS